MGDLKAFFSILLHQGAREDTTPFPRLLHFTLDPYLIMLSVNQVPVFWVIGMIRPEIELQPPGPLVNTLLIRPMEMYKNKREIYRVK